jgi:hypothetical protein
MIFLMPEEGMLLVNWLNGFIVLLERETFPRFRRMCPRGPVMDREWKRTHAKRPL